MKGTTKEEIANRLHVTRQTISKWEKNYSVPDVEILVKLAEILGNNGTGRIVF
jgi:putative transcriptional regulator